MHSTAAVARAPLTLDEAAALVSRLQHELRQVIIGQDRVVAEVLVAFLAGGHCLVRGVPASRRRSSSGHWPTRCTCGSAASSSRPT
ncbi:MAG: hypothetical protein R2712_07155 [Vicinamibacterales bacterium]